MTKLLEVEREGEGGLGSFPGVQKVLLTLWHDRLSRSSHDVSGSRIRKSDFGLAVLIDGP